MFSHIGLPTSETAPLHPHPAQGAGTDVVLRVHVRSLVGVHLVGVHEEELRLVER